jgi:hypothetical protein
MAFDQDGLIQAAQIDYVEDDGAYPNPWPVPVTGATGSFFPGPYRVAKAGFTTKAIYTNTAGRTCLPGAVDVRVRGSRAACSTKPLARSGSIRSSCAGGTS